jgi:RHS repeat-associated protein
MQQQPVSVLKKCGTGVPPVDASRCARANKLTNIHVGAQNANNRYWYDVAGNLTTGIVNGLTNCYYYNAQNKLAYLSLYLDGRYIRYSFSYDSLNRRIKIWTSAESTGQPRLEYYNISRHILHDGTLPIAEITDELSPPGTTPIRRYFVRGVGIADGTGDMIADIIGTASGNAKAVFYLSNHRADTLATYRGDSTRVTKYRYDAFGNVRTAYCVVSEPENAPRYTFSTKQYLPEAQLYLYAYRVYDPQAGRWTQRDPIDYQDSLNLYQFCRNSPLGSLDVDGRFAWALIPAAVVIGIGLNVIITEVRVYILDEATAAVPKAFPFVTFHGSDYFSLGEAARHVIDAHEDRHHGYGNRFDGVDDEIPVHQISYKEASAILKKGKFNGRKITKDERQQLMAIKEESRRELKKLMKPKDYSEWRKKSA